MTETRPDPIYQRLHQALRDLLGSDGFPPGAKFLTERQVAEQFGVSRPTANKALATLVGEGRLEFRKGIGTFVRRSLDYDLQRLVSFTDAARRAGRTPTTRVLAFRRVPPGDGRAVAERMGLGTGVAMVFLERLRMADGVPVILERRHVVAGHCPTLRRADAEGSLYAAWTGKCGLTIAGAGQVVRAVTLTAADAGLLEVAVGGAALVVESVGTLAGGQPLWYERTIYRADAYEFHNQLGGPAPPRPAVGTLAGPVRSLLPSEKSS